MMDPTSNVSPQVDQYTCILQYCYDQINDSEFGVIHCRNGSFVGSDSDRPGHDRRTTDLGRR